MRVPRFEVLRVYNNPPPFHEQRLYCVIDNWTGQKNAPVPDEADALATAAWLNDRAAGYASLPYLLPWPTGS